MIKLLEIFKRLFEAKCPTCGAEGAYIGLHSIECPNSSCTHYDQNIDVGLSKDVNLAMRVIGLWDVSDTFEIIEDESVMGKIGMKRLSGYNPAGTYYDPKFWKETSRMPSPRDNEVLLYINGYVYLRAIHPESKKLAKWLNEPKQLKASKDNFSDYEEDLPQDLRGKINALWTTIEVNEPSWLNYDMEKIGEYLNTLVKDEG